MPYELKWILPEYILFQHLHGEYSASEVGECDAKTVELMEGSPQKHVHLIIDDANITQMPPVTALAKVKSSRHDKLGWTIVFGNKSVGMRFTTTLANRILGFKMIIVPTYEEAVEKLYELDPDLPPLEDDQPPSED